MLHQIKEPDFLTFTCSTEQHRHLFLMMNCYLMGLIFESDTSVKHVLHLPLPCPFVVDLTRKALSALCLCPRLAQIPPRHNSAAAAQVGDTQIDFGNVGSGWEIQHMFWQGIYFLLSAPCPTSLAYSPEIFPLFCGTEQGMNTKYLLRSCRDNRIPSGFCERWGFI